MLCYRNLALWISAKIVLAVSCFAFGFNPGLRKQLEQEVGASDISSSLFIFLVSFYLVRITYYLRCFILSGKAFTYVAK